MVFLFLIIFNDENDRDFEKKNIQTKPQVLLLCIKICWQKMKRYKKNCGLLLVFLFIYTSFSYTSTQLLMPKPLLLHQITLSKY